MVDVPLATFLKLAPLTFDISHRCRALQVMDDDMLRQAAVTLRAFRFPALILDAVLAVRVAS